MYILMVELKLYNKLEEIKRILSIARGRSAPPSSPTRATHGRCVLCHLCRGVVARLCTSVHGSVSVVHGVHSVPECRWPWRRFSASVLRSVRTFAECVGLCRRTRRASESVWRLGRVVRGSGKTAPERISAWGAKSEPWRRIRELFRPEGKVATFPGAPGAVRGRIWRFGQIWRPGGYSN